MDRIWALQCNKSSGDWCNGVQKVSHVMNDMVYTQSGQFFRLGHGIMGDARETDHFAARSEGSSSACDAVLDHQAVVRPEARALCRKLIKNEQTSEYYYGG